MDSTNRISLMMGLVMVVMRLSQALCLAGLEDDDRPTDNAPARKLMILMVLLFQPLSAPRQMEYGMVKHEEQSSMLVIVHH